MNRPFSLSPKRNQTEEVPDEFDFEPLQKKQKKKVVKKVPKKSNKLLKVDRNKVCKELTYQSRISPKSKVSSRLYLDASLRDLKNNYLVQIEREKSSAHSSPLRSASSRYQTPEKNKSYKQPSLNSSQRTFQDQPKRKQVRKEIKESPVGKKMQQVKKSVNFHKGRKVQ